ncbi:MAG: ABC transporter permease, partial [Clostridium sp.]|nr:ABC transporter permease [Clostridium sp.]
MLGKLLKYEVKATAMTFGLLYLAIIGFAICNKVFGSFQFNWGAVITGTVLVGLFVALGVVTIVVVVQRFKRNLLGDEGYLMFTLPVKAGSLITSKLLVTIMWTVASCIVGLITFSILISGEINVYEIIKLLGEEWSRISSEFFANTHMQLSIYLILMAIGLLACYVEFILIIYTALSCA